MIANAQDANRMICKLQFHYWFSDKSHTMDALIHNKCERELLELTKAIAKICAVSVTMETEPTGKGGLKNWLTIAAKFPKKTPASKITFINAAVAACVVTPSQTSISTAFDALLNKFLLEQTDGQLGLSKPELNELKEIFTNLLPLLDTNNILKKRRSNFYDLLRKYQKVKCVSVSLTNEIKKPITEDILIPKEKFKTFLVSSDAVAPEMIESAQIEIISPVLAKGTHKWRGMYKSEPISFVMKSDEFMNMVQDGKVEFKSGSSISCILQIDKKITGVGVERITGYSILSVSSYSENGKTLETLDAKQKQKQQVVSKRPLDLFG